MLYLVEAHASMERGNKIDGEKGPGPIFAKIVERFRPEAFYGNPSRRQIFLVPCPVGPSAGRCYSPWWG